MVHTLRSFVAPKINFTNGSYTVVSTINYTSNELTYPIESGGSWTEPARWEQPIRPRTQETRHDARYAALVALARPARSLRLGLLSARIPPLRRVDHRHGPQCRRTHRHPVCLGLGATLRLEGHGIVRRIRRLAPRPRHSQPHRLG